jgi:hypothetical protein
MFLFSSVDGIKSPYPKITEERPDGKSEKAHLQQILKREVMQVEFLIS